MPVAVLLSFAIVSEVTATIALRYSDGFTRPGPIAIVVVGYGVSFWLLALVLREMSIGATYADRLARRGYDLILVARSQKKLDEVAGRIAGVGQSSVRIGSTRGGL